jgi:hypothetical protein
LLFLTGTKKGKDASPSNQVNAVIKIITIGHLKSLMSIFFIATHFYISIKTAPDGPGPRELLKL